MIRRPPKSTLSSSSAASDVYKRQAKYLEGKDFDTIELCGLVSNICVLSNAVMAKSACPNSEIIVDSSLTAAADEELHQKSLDVMKGLFIKVL